MFSSIKAAFESKLASLLNFDIICKPIGRPLGVKPHGRDNAGEPVNVTADTIFNHSI